MADSLTITVASPPGTSHMPAPPISLATALEDIVELAQKLERSFAKVSDDLQNAQSFAAEILETVEKIKAFCDEHYEALNSSDDTKRVLFDLTRDMKAVYASCGDLRPAPTPAKTRKLKTTVGAWKDSHKIESSILELRNRVNKWHTQIMIFAVMNTENQLVFSGNSSSQALSTIRQEVSRTWISDERIISFLGTSSATLSRLPPAITTYFIADAFIRAQISTIDDNLAQLSSAGSYPIEEPIEAYLLPYQPVVVNHSTEDGATLRQDVIAKILEIQDLVRNDSSTLSIQTGAWEMVNLCTALFSLEMYQEAATMGLWTVNLFRTLVRTDSTIYSPYLSHSLRHLSWFYAKIEDLDGAEKAIEESARISRRLHASSKELEVKAQIVPVLTMRAYVASLKGENGRALEHAEESVRIFEVMIDENRAVDSQSSLQLVRTEQEWAQALLNFPDQAICNYSRALQQLSTCLQDTGRLADAVEAQLKATTIMGFISHYYPDGALEPELAEMLFRLSHQDFHDEVPLDEALGHSQQAVEIYRRLAEKNSGKYGRSLCNALWEQANILGKLERYDAALSVWKETADLAKEIMADQLYHANALEQVSWSFRRLKRHDEAAATRTESVKVYHSVLNSTSVTEAHAYYDLGVDFQLAGRYPEAIEASKMAITQYRALAFYEPDKYTKNVAKGLNSLTGILVSAKDHEQAFNEGHEALKLYETLIYDDSTVLPDYIRSLNLNSLVAMVSDNQTKSLERILDVLRHSRELVKRFPGSADEDSVLVRSIRNHSQILTNLGRLDEASLCVQEALAWYDEHPATAPKPVLQHMECLIDIGSILDNQGHTEKALVPIEKAVAVGKPFSHNGAVASLVVGSMHRRAQLFLELGQYAEGVVASEEGVAFARATTLENIADFIGSLQVASMAYKYSGRADEAITSIKEALELCRGDALAELIKTRGVLLLHLPQCLQQLSSNLAAAGKEEEALPLAQEAVDEAMNLKSKHATLPWSEIEPTYMGALYNLSIRLAANPDLPRALELVVQCRNYFEERSQSRNGVFTFLACVIRAEGILHCASGKHEEGIAAMTRLSDLQKRLETEFPSLARLVEIELDGDRKLPSWIALLAKLDLQCRHQDQEITL